MADNTFRPDESGRWTGQNRTGSRQPVESFYGSENDGGAAVPNEDTAGVGGAPATESGAVTGKKPGLLSGLRDWRLRSKLAAVLIIPTLTALVLGALRAVDDAAEAAKFQRTADQVAFAVKVTTVVHELQSERSLAVARLSSGNPLLQTGLDAQIAKVDREVKEMPRDLAKVPEIGDRHQIRFVRR